eukprot:scaffold10623_cov65-Cyclotella_meneghiniana.AAC.7
MECLHIGTPPPDYECWESKIIHMHNFLDLPDTKSDDNVVFSPEFKCFGHTWQLEIFPGGTEEATDGFISAWILNTSDEQISLDFEIILLKACGEDSVWGTGEVIGNTFAPFEEEEVGVMDYLYGDNDLVERTTLLENQSDYLNNGTLKIKVNMRLNRLYYHNRIRQDLPEIYLLDIWEDEETSDIAFNLKDGIILAHKCIIKSKANELYVMCEGYSKTTPMPIDDVDSGVFEIMLASLYFGGDVYPDDWQKHSEAILKAAGKYGFSALRSEAEIWHSKSLNFTVDNVIAKFMNADGNNHALVKAAAKKFIVEHAEDVVESDSFHLLYESKELIREVMKAVASGNGNKRRREG